MKNKITKFWFFIRESKIKTLLFVSLTGVLIYFLLIIAFGFIYWKFSCIGNSNNLEQNLLNNIYFSFVSFMTIGFGDLYPINTLGKIVLLFETISSLLFIGLFPSILIYYSLKRQNSLYFTDKLLITRSKSGKFIVKMKIANKGANISQINISFKVFSYSATGGRNKLFYRKKLYALFEENTATSINLFLDNEKSEPLLIKIKKVLTTNEKFVMRVSLNALDTNTGDNLNLVKYYKKENLLFGYVFMNVGNWSDDNISKPNWENFNKVEDKTKEILLNDLLNYNPFKIKTIA